MLLQSALGRWLWSLDSSMAGGMWRPPRWNGTSGRRSCGLAASGVWVGKCDGAAATRRRQGFRSPPTLALLAAFTSYEPRSACPHSATLPHRSSPRDASCPAAGAMIAWDVDAGGGR